jgi:hypothetical protein
MMVCRLRLAEEHMTYLKPPRDDGCSAADRLADFYFVSHKGALQGFVIGGGAEALGPHALDQVRTSRHGGRIGAELPS